MGFGDFALARQLGSGISSVRPPRYEIGRETAATMLRLMGQGAPRDKAARSVRVGVDVPWQLVERGSTARSGAG